MKYKYEVAMKVAEEIVGWLKPYCERIQIAGSLRRKKAEVGDIELLCIPVPISPTSLWLGDPPYDNLDYKIREMIKDVWLLDYRLNVKGSRIYGRQNKLLVHCASGIPVDIFSTTEENWWVALLVRTGPKESNIRICMEAKRKGLKFNAYGSGFTNPNGEKIICFSEKEVFNAVELPHLPPEKR